MVDQKATVILATVTASPKPVFVKIFKKADPIVESSIGVLPAEYPRTHLQATL